MLIKEVIQYLESIAPPHYQESYDNAGLIVGNSNWKITGALVCLDSTETIVEEAIQKGCNLIIAHHPIVFKGLKRFNGKNYIERTVIKAIKADIAIYAIHTNLDNMYHNGVNTMIAKRLGLKKTKVLAPKNVLKKLFVFVPVKSIDKVRNSLFEIGAGHTIGKNISYMGIGAGTKNVSGGAVAKLEVSFPSIIQHKISALLDDTLSKSIIGYDIVEVENSLATVGSGMIGKLPTAMKNIQFLSFLKERMNATCVKHTALLDKKIKKVAICGGSGGFLLSHAIRQQADIFITADYKYHEFFDADGQIIIADIGHYESEQFTNELLYELLRQKFRNFATQITEHNTNPVQYFF